MKSSGDLTLVGNKRLEDLGGKSDGKIIGDFIEGVTDGSLSDDEIIAWLKNVYENCECLGSHRVDIENEGF